ncbi:amidohydrolase family protein [Thalassoroseus pseudoceratinae]|uniref:amidohydrolase family protein n=1 Tax=Thalassoroseus pseudoceratinae TaxID=2713176 RepID=UPI001F101F5F|nr:amidohydrolase family protein [Thalassoroseus pseudoceratinae]
MNQTSLSRRGMLHTSAATAAGVLTGSLLQAADKATTPETGWIDAHSHIWTRDVERFPLAEGQTVADLAPPSFTAEELLEVAGKENVSRVVLIQHHIYHGWDNSYLIWAAKEYPKKFRVVGMVDDTQPNPDQKMRELLPQRVTAFRITSGIRGAKDWLSGPGMDAMWKCAAETGQSMCCLINPEDLPAVNAMCKKHPDTPVVIDHFARVGIDGTIRERDLKQLCDLAKYPKTALKISAYYALGKKKPPHTELVPMIRRVLDAYGTERCMWASDSPYQIVKPNTYHDSIALVRDRMDFLSDSDRENLLRRTAERVYFYDA